MRNTFSLSPSPAYFSLNDYPDHQKSGNKQGYFCYFISTPFEYFWFLITNPGFEAGRKAGMMQCAYGPHVVPPASIVLQETQLPCRNRCSTNLPQMIIAQCRPASAFPPRYSYVSLVTWKSTQIRWSECWRLCGLSSVHSLPLRSHSPLHV